MIRLRDVVHTSDGDGARGVVLRGADLQVDEGVTSVIRTFGADARRAVVDLLLTRRAPSYGEVDVVRPVIGPVRLPEGTPPSTIVIDAEARPGTQARRPGDTVVVVTEGTEAPGVPTGAPRWELRGGRFVPGGSLADDPGAFGAQPAVAAPNADVGSGRFSPERLHEAVYATLTGHLVAPGIADEVARVLVDAEVRGHRSHGVALLPTYLRRMREGGIRPGAGPERTDHGPTRASFDAGGGFGQPAAFEAAEWCARTAAAHGVAVANVHSNNHVGMLAAYRGPFQRHGVVGLILNISGPSVAPPGAARPTLGSNAVCLVTPVSKGAYDEPFCIDYATGVVAAGKIRDAGNRGADVPPDWLTGPDGKPATDPSLLDQGGSIPVFGGHKGLCTTLIVEILAGALAGNTVSPNVAKQRKEPGRVMGCSQLFLGLSADTFGADTGAAVVSLEEAVLRGHDGAVPDGHWFPDQMERAHEAAVREEGILVPDQVLGELGWHTPPETAVAGA